MVDPNWEGKLAEIVSGVDHEPDRPPSAPATPGQSTVDLRDPTVPPVPSSDELAEWVERVGASVLRLVDRRVVELSDEVASQLAALDSRIDVLVDVVASLTTQVAAVARALEIR